MDGTPLAPGQVAIEHDGDAGLCASEVVCRDRGELARAMAQNIANRLKAAIAARGHAVLAVSGGRSPQLLFESLCVLPLPWSQVTITLVDERWVDHDHHDSNAAFVLKYLLQGGARAAEFLPLKNDAPDPVTGQAACETSLRSLPLPFDVVVLGMGDDGHTASLFPGSEELAQALDTDRPALCAAVHPIDAPHPRISLTLRALLSSRVLMLPLSGQSKLDRYRLAREDGPIEAMPIRAVLRQQTVPVLKWISP